MTQHTHQPLSTVTGLPKPAGCTDAPLYFNCNMCGECCSSWNIPIEGDKARALLEKPWVQERLATVRRDLVRVSEDLYRLPLTDENVCVFLAEDKRCLVEANEGLALKPHECRRFPFATVRMPDGAMRHDTSAACKLIAEKLLLAFQPILPKPKLAEDLFSLENLKIQEDGQYDEIEGFPERIYLGLFRKTNLEIYEAWLESLHPLFSDPAISSEQALFETRRRLNSLSKLQFNLGTSSFRGSPSFPEHRTYWLLLLFLRKPYKTFSWISLIRGKTYDDPRLFGLPVNLREQAKIPWNPALDYHVNAFLLNLLNRKLLIARGHSLSAMLAMAATACLLVRWYARTLAWGRFSPAVETGDVAMAIRLTERYYTGHQPRFLHFFSNRCYAKLIEIGIDIFFHDESNNGESRSGNDRSTS